MTHQQPARLIDILAENTKAENLDCPVCQGHGVITAFDHDTGIEEVDCETCAGSGFNQLGLIMHGLLAPPEEGFGPNELQEALKSPPSNTDRGSLLKRLKAARASAQAPLSTPHDPFMPGQNSANNVVSLNRLSLLASRRYNLLKLRDRLQQELDTVDKEMKEQMLEGEIAFADNGIGYRLNVIRQEVYGREVTQELDAMGLLPHFSRISTTRLKEMVHQGLLNHEQFRTLKSKAREREISTLREVVNPDSRVI